MSIIYHRSSGALLLRRNAPSLKLRYVKSNEVEKYAGLWMRVDGQQNQVLSFDNMQNRPFRETTDWKKYEVVLDVPYHLLLLLKTYILLIL